MQVRKLFALVAVLAALYFGWSRFDGFYDATTPAGQPRSALSASFDERDSGRQVEGSGIVVRILPDDNHGSRHQRFILRLASGQTLLMAHNIDLAPRIASLREGDAVAFSGEFEWNPKGGVVHWTHRDPAGRHVAGWLKHEGRTYQ